MKRFAVALIIGLLALLVANVGAFAAGLDNGSFESAQEPRSGYQGWEDELIFGWKAFAGTAWLDDSIEHVSVVKADDAVGEKYLKLVGIEGNYVGVRSVHVPVTKNGIYTLSAKAFVKDMADPSRLQIWLEFWPENPEAENSASRMKYSKGRASVLGSWVNLEVSDVAPPDAATATALIIIHKSGNPPLPAEVYVDDVKLEELK